MGNYSCAMAGNVHEQVESQILTEIQNGRYRIVDYKPCIVSALGAIPKQDLNKICVFYDASRPIGEALNDAIIDNFSVSFSAGRCGPSNPRLFLCLSGFSKCILQCQISRI